MKENTQIENPLELNEQQLRDISGGEGIVDKLERRRYDTSFKNAEKEYKTNARDYSTGQSLSAIIGSYDVASNAAPKVAASLEKINNLNAKEQARLATKQLGK